MLLSELLNARAVAARLKAGTKRDAMIELVGLLETGHGLESRGEILDRVLRREAMMSTGIGNGVAIPHGKARSVDRMLAACAVSREGVDFDSIDGQPTYIFFVVVAPENSTGIHLKALARISRLFKDPEFRQRLLAAPDAHEMYRTIADEDAKY